MIELRDLPTLNATLNGLAALLLFAGWLAIRAQRRTLHKRLMLSAFATSTLFLISYVTYHYGAPTTPFTGQGAARVLYFLILVPHIVLATAVVPLALYLLYRALRGEFTRHKRVARWALPIWLYVSVTGVLVYLMLYVFYPAPA